MYRVTQKVLVFRYGYVMRQRWILTITYLLFPLILCSLAMWSYDSELLHRYNSPIEEHDERSLMQLLSNKNCSISAADDCKLKLFVCPGGVKERQLMDIVVSSLKLDGKSALDITYVNNSDHFANMLPSEDSNYSRGLHFIEISSNKLEYAIRPRALSIPTLLYDWGDYATTQRFPSPMFRGPRLTDPYFNVETEFLVLGGFLPIQVAVDKAYIKTFFPQVSKEWILTSFPHPPYYELPVQFRMLLSQRFYLIQVQYLLMMGIIIMISVFASYTIGDKMSGIREWLCLNGAVRWMVNLSWLISFFFEATILAVVEVGILKIPTSNGPTIQYMSALVLTLVVIVQNWFSLCWVHLFATALQNRIVCISIIAAYWTLSPLLHYIPPDRLVLQGLLATLPNAGLILIFKSFQEFDGAETVLDLTRVNTFPIHFLSVGAVLLIMLSTSLLLILLAVYVDLVSPGPFGRAKSWYLFEKKAKMQFHTDRDLYPQEESHFEEISDSEPIGLECEGISKSFKTRKVPCCRFYKAVNNVNMKIPKGKITVLLGPNGAGKTTLFSMLCGMYSPSMGHFYTEDYDVFQGDNIKKFRKVLGYCPQNNLVMNELTVRQHLIIFGLLKGLSRDEAEESSEEWTETFEMGDFENTIAEKLSGGTKRKLCLAIAMTGNPQYLLLDEPSSGLDIKSRRIFWDILLKEKSNYTVVVTTHDMEEAEVLGDRIALLANGQLVGYGSSSFLKEQLDAGYKINCAVNNKDRIKVLKFVESFDRSISLIFETHSTVTLGIPLNKSKIIPNFLKSMKSEFGDGIITSISHVTMDDVLIEFHSSEKTSKSADHVDALSLKEDDIEKSTNWGNIKEMFKKKVEWTLNQNLTALIFLIFIFPIIGIESAVYFTNRVVGGSTLDVADLKLSMDAYSGKRAFIIKREDDISSALTRAMNTSNIRYDVVSNDMVDFLNSVAKKDLFEYRSQVVFAFDSGNQASDISTAYYSRNAFHTAPIAYSALINAILPGNTSITTHNFPFKEQHIGKPCLVAVPQIVAILFQIFLGPMLLIAGSYFVILPHIERRTLFKHLQLMAGLHPWLYWISHLMFDMLIFSMSVLLVIVILAADEDLGIFSNEKAMSALVVVLLLYSISIIVFAYACSFCRCSTSIVVVWFICIPPLLLLAYYSQTLILMDNFISIKSLYFLPWVILMKSLEKVSTWGSLRKACYQCSDASACRFISTHSLIDWLKTELVSFMITSLFYFVFIVAMDHGFGRKLKPMVDRLCHGEIVNKQDTDPEVEKERQRIKNLNMEADSSQPELVCNGLGKKFSAKVTAVRDVSFAQERGNVFGLLGANGSGKSTTLGMLAAAISPTNGSATIRGKWELTDCEYKYIRNIGFCPQFGGILPGLSGRNTLKLFACLRGLKPAALRDSHVDRWIEALDMVSLADRPCDQYSTGNKRKLSFAIAMIGYPSVVLLDEPTAGIDMVVRRRIGEILSRRESNQAVVLTSHIMSECDAICDRVTIMFKGEMKCLGTVQELKSAFGKSCTLQVKLRSDTTAKKMDLVLQKILKESPFARYAQLEEKQMNLLTVNVKTEKIKVYDVFADMLKIKEDNSSIEDFSLTGTPLEEAFLTFARSSS